MSGNSAAMAPIAHGPADPLDHDGPFNARQLTRIDEAITLSSRETGLIFSLYLGELADPSRASAEDLFGKLSPDAVLVAVSPGQRVLQIVTGEISGARLPNRACALAALGMRAAFTNGDLVGGIVTGLRMLSDAAGRP
ncbi:uncharacterized protein DUF5130 [Jatrophihabitans sp. GAS493]|uniref:DUF5130 family protein n=1 Tax=Jatrophihabitans sp. GAS493 TaxID=1907575 RepID=UPI000BBFAD81|nr:DUF5130 family protein [Jatrophihabitans sp. GAS493]SOD72846.1 uncharacterized protein DUF5130 [Jatrophihabitans sp. GAS493]